MHLDWPILERTGAVAGGIIVGVVAFYALYKDWKTPGLENQVFKLMLLLLGFGALVGNLRGRGRARKLWEGISDDRSGFRISRFQPSPAKQGRSQVDRLLGHHRPRHDLRDRRVGDIACG